MRSDTPTLFVLLILYTLVLAGCNKSGNSQSGTSGEIVLYTSVDEPAARPVIDAFEKKTGLKVRLVADTEANKSVGLAERLRAERNRPQADVWWGNEPFLTVALADEGLLQPYQPSTAGDVRPLFQDKDHRWTGNGLRARVLVAHRPPYADGPGEELARRAGRLNAAASAKGLDDLLNPALKGQVALARPTAGTTGSHVAALYALWGQDRADAFFRKLHANGVALLAGNSLVAQQVGAGNFWLGLTDNDDIQNASEAGGGVALVLPDQGDGEIGTLTLPTTVGLVAGRPDSADATKLVDFLASAEAENLLLAERYVAYSVRDGDGRDGRNVRSMDVDYKAVADALPEAVRRATALLEGDTP